MENREIVQALSDAHRRMEHVLTLVRFHVDTLKSGNDVDACKFLKNAFSYMHNFPGLAHHPTEEVLFAQLTSRAPQTKALCGRLAKQHEDFGRQETLLMRNIRDLQGGELAAYRRTKEMGAAYCNAHADHIQSEETDFIPQTLKWLSEEDWKHVGEQAKLLIDPLFEWQHLNRYDNLYDYLMGANGEFNLH